MAWRCCPRHADASRDSFHSSLRDDLGTLDVQRFVLQKMEAGFGWECANHYRNLLSKIFTVAKKWGYFAGANPVAGVELPEKVAE
jgi:hypothetical protein